MRHRKKKKILDRPRSKKELLIKNLAQDLILRKKIKTTAAKARLLKSFMDRNLARLTKDDLLARRYLRHNFSQKTISIIFKDLKPKYKGNISGFVRIIKYRNRKGDNAPLVYIELT